MVTDLKKTDDEYASGMKTILLTVVIALGAAILFPVKDQEQEGAP